MPVRNEDWIAGLSVRVALQWCDELVVLDHASTDNTLEVLCAIAKEHPKRIHLISEPDADWHEMEHRQKMLDCARTNKATHVAIIDADEVLTANLVPSIRQMVAEMRPEWMLQLPGYNLRGSVNRYHANGIWGNRWFSTVFADNPYLSWTGDRFHHREPMNYYFAPWHAVRQGEGGVLHFWGASERRLVAKHASYKMTERLRWPDKPLSEIDRTYGLAFYPHLGPQFEQKWRYADVPSEWTHPDLMQHLHLDGEPWQERECARLLAEHDEDRFKGLDLFGVTYSASPSRA